MASIPLTIHPSFWLVAVLIGWLSSATLGDAAVWVAVITLSLLVHEYGHALTALYFGQRCTVELMLYGGVTKRSGGLLKQWQQFLVVLNGPLAGLTLALASYLLLEAAGAALPRPLTYALTVALYINVFWTAVNLLPIHPLDGGQLLSIALQGLFGLRGLQAALLGGVLVGLAASMAFFWKGLLLAGALFMLITYESWRSWRSSLSMSSEDQDDALQRQYQEAQQEIDQGRWDRAAFLLQQVYDHSHSGMLHDNAAVFLAQVSARDGDFRRCYALLHPLREALEDLPLELFVASCLKTGGYQEGALYGDILYRQRPSSQSALLNARCHARLGHEQQAIGWLRCAVRDGLAHAKHVAMEADFDKLRDSAAFRLWQQEQR